MTDSLRRPLDIRLRPVTRADLSTLFEMQQDPESNRMSFSRPRTREAFDAAWEKTLTAQTPGTGGRVIVLRHDQTGEDEIVGSIGSFVMDGVNAVGYQVVRRYWGRGIASRALAMLLEEVSTRPLHARAAAANMGSCKVLLRCGFRLTETKFCPESADGRHLACEVSSFILR